jgi:hypothetical protein
MEQPGNWIVIGLVFLPDNFFVGSSKNKKSHRRRSVRCPPDRFEGGAYFWDCY